MSHIHIPDGVLPLLIWLPGWILALLLVTLAGRLAERTQVRRKVPLLAVVSALMLVAMSSEIVPLAYHVNLTVIAGVLLGPVLSVIAAFIVEVVLAMLGHGGVPVTDDPLFVELGAFLIGQPRCNLTERFRRAGCFGKGHRNGFGAVFFGRKQVNITFGGGHKISLSK